jgi:hypothetical protein
MAIVARERSFIDWEDVISAAELSAGNHEHFDSWCWYSPPDNSEDYAIFYTSNRDSGLLDKSNEAVILEALKEFLEADEPEVWIERHNHFAVGFCDALVMKVLDDDRAPTAVFRKYAELMARLNDYPILDEDEYGAREYSQTLSNIEEAGKRFVRADAPDDWPSQCFSWFWENDQGAVENRDDNGGYPDREAIRKALLELEYLDAEFTILLGDGDEAVPYLITQSQSSAQKTYADLVYWSSLGLWPNQKVSLLLDDEPIEESEGV